MKLHRVMRRRAERFASLEKVDVGDRWEQMDAHQRGGLVAVVGGPMAASGSLAVQSYLVAAPTVQAARELVESKHWEMDMPKDNEGIELLETTTLGEGVKVDKSAGLIRNVKVIGFNSQHGRTYTPAALKGAVPMYEGAKVNIDHPARGSDPRRVGDRFGKFEGVEFVEGFGLRGTLRYNTAHPLAGQVAWFAENMPEAIGMSHNALGVERREAGGGVFVDRLLKVRSVDLVADGATTRGLFESQGDGGLQESVAAIIASDGSAADKVRRIGQLLEGGAEADDKRTENQTMKPEDITAEMLEQRPDLKKAILDKAGQATQVAELQETVKALTSKLDEFKTKEALAGKKAKARELIEAAKLPKEAVTPEFTELVEGAADDATMGKIIADRKKLVESIGSKGVKSGRQELQEGMGRAAGGAGNNADGTPATYDAFVQGMKGR